MKYIAFAAVAALMAWAACYAPVQQVKADVEVSVEIDFNFFYERLAPQGEWLEVDDYGYCWCPDDIDDDWRPYCDGHWVYSDDDGWCWETDEEYGWAVYHYGRWTHVDDCGWVWVPGYEWSGAWVCWRHGNGHAGWAALPPRAIYHDGRGVDDVEFEASIYYSGWVFVLEADFCASRVRTVAISRDRIVVLVRETTYVGAVKWKHRPFNEGITIVVVERFSTQKVVRVRIEGTLTLGASRTSHSETGVVRHFRPGVKKDGKDKPPSHSDHDAHKRAQSKTLSEKHEAERNDVQKDNKDEKVRGEETRRLEDRHKVETKDLDDKIEKQRKDPPKETHRAPKKEDPQQPRKETTPPKKEEPLPPRKEAPPPKKEDPVPPKKETPPPKKEDPEPPKKETPPKKEKPPKKDGEEEEG